jgi:hypothetical protein
MAALHFFARTLGFEDPAKPALILAVPLSITIGWLSSKGVLASPSPAASASAALAMVAAAVLCCQAPWRLRGEPGHPRSGQMDGIGIRNDNYFITNFHRADHFFNAEVDFFI